MKMLTKNKVKELTNLLIDLLSKSDFIEKICEHEENHFSKSDLNFSVHSVLARLRKGDLLSWMESMEEIKIQQPKKLLCVLAGNLPMVGLQDILAACITGIPTAAKISKKDAVLIPSVINRLQQNGFAQNIFTNTELTKFTDWQASHYIFTGDQTNFQKLESVLLSNHIITSDAVALVRRAMASIAIMSEANTLSADLLDAISRYNGKGCRSVGLLLYDESNKLDSFFTELNEDIQNQSYHTPSQVNLYDRAYYRSIGFKAKLLDGFLFTTYPFAWKKYAQISLLTIDKWLALKEHHGLIQSVYHTSPEKVNNQLFNGHRLEPISQAQVPPLYWKADQIDVLTWLLK